MDAGTDHVAARRSKGPGKGREKPRQRSLQAHPSRKVKKVTVSSYEQRAGEEVAGPGDGGLAGAWTEEMESRRIEVELLLRQPLQSDEDILFALAAAEAGLLFMEQLDRAAKSVGVLRGTLSRWLLPYDNNTRIDEQSSEVKMVMNS
eukprot:gene11922-15195_t